MSDVVRVELLDADAAIREGLDGTGGATRADLFRKAALGGGAFLGGGLLISGFPAIAGAQGGSAAQDVEILNFALLLEYLEAAFYAEANARGALTGELAEFARVVGAHENAHVEFIRGALGSAARARPTFDFQNTTGSAATFQATALVLEDTGVSAYNGQGPNVRRAILPAAASIVSVEARHAAWIRRLVAGPGYSGGPSTYPAPAVLDTALTREQVEQAVGQTNFIRG